MLQKEIGNKMKKIVLVDYLGTCDEKNHPIGHTVKVLNEYSEMLSAHYEVWVATAESSHRKVHNPNKIYAPYAINLGATGKKEKLENIGKRLKNIVYILKQGEGNPIWICSSDFYIFLYLFIKPKRKEKTIITIYRSNFNGEKFSKIKNRIFEKALKKVDLVICSDKKLNIGQVPFFVMPDYLYKREQYEKYHSIKKEEKVVCLGTMGRNKLLPELVDAFNQNGYPLEIIGKFFDKELYEELEKKAKDNIRIQNSYISDEEYLKLLASAKYAVLPYNMHMYQARTSGVILESVFMHTIPIANKSLLDYMDIPGIGYEDIAELSTTDLSQKIFEYNFDDFIKKNYSYEEIKKNLLQYFMNMNL